MMDLAIILRATIVLGAALLIAQLCGRARASVRHVILAAAFGILVALPVSLVYLIFQRYIVGGLAIGGVKG